ncbi:MAG: hypothetical protein DRG78_02660 [Epsilonproteobacteria bacterium]|nr:MAG: hypothetical protein DRG78_02660 [Campylobacterota bacterium]
MGKSYIITIAHDKGGSGKSITAMNLATELSKTNDEFTIVDLDLKQQHLSKFNANRKKKHNLWINQVNVKTINELKEELMKIKGIVLIDTAGLDSELSRVAKFLSDLVITPLNNGDTEMDVLKDFKNQMSSMIEKRDDLKCMVLVNRLHHADTKTHKAFKKYLKGTKNFSIFDTVLRMRKEYPNTMTRGTSVSEKSKGTAGIEFLKFVDEVNKKIKKGMSNG